MHDRTEARPTSGRPRELEVRGEFEFAFANRFRWLSITPLGVPIEPEVKSSIPRSLFCRRGGGNGSRASFFSAKRKVEGVECSWGALKSAGVLIRTSG